MAQVHVKSLNKTFPDGTVAVEHLDLDIRDGELFVMLGPSGCGKTTTLRIIAGLEEETAGTVTIGDEVVSGLRPSQRDIAMVFQFYALYPHLSRARQHGVPAARGQGAGVRDQRARRRGRADAPARAVPDSQAEQAVRRRAAAGGARPRDGAPSEGVPDGRAADQPRRRAARRHARGGQARPAAPEHHDDLRHARSDRGDGAGSPDRDPQQGQARAARRPDGGLRAPGVAVRRALHRVAADEPGRGRGDQRSPDRGRRVEDRRARGPAAFPEGDRRRPPRALQRGRRRRRRAWSRRLQGSARRRDDLRRRDRGRAPERPHAPDRPLRRGAERLRDARRAPLRPRTTPTASR